MSRLDCAKAHFSSLESKRIEIPEWGESPEKPMIIHSDPVKLTDRNWAYEQAGGVNLYYNVYLIIRMAKTEDGKKMFSIGDSNDLKRNVDPAVVVWLADQINDSESVEDIEKK